METKITKNTHNNQKAVISQIFCIIRVSSFFVKQAIEQQFNAGQIVLYGQNHEWRLPIF